MLKIDTYGFYEKGLQNWNSKFEFHFHADYTPPPEADVTDNKPTIY